MIESRKFTSCNWELIQSVCFDESIFLCILKGCGEKYFLFVSENEKINNLNEFEGLETAQEHFSRLFTEMSKYKGIENAVFSPI